MSNIICNNRFRGNSTTGINLDSTTGDNTWYPVYWWINPCYKTWQSCPKCGKCIECGDRYCRHCGKQLIIPKYCPHCGKEI